MRVIGRTLVTLAAALGLGTSAATETVPARIGRFPQEVAVQYTVAQGLPSDNVWAVLFADDGTVYASTDKGLARLDDGAWTPVQTPPPNTELVHTLCVAQIDRLFITGPVDTPPEPVLLPSLAFSGETFRDVVLHDDTFFIATDRGLVKEVRFKGITRLIEGISVNQLAVAPDGRIAAATDAGLYLENAGGAFEPAVVEDGQGRRWAASDVSGAAYEPNGDLWFATLAGVGRLAEKVRTFYTGAAGLPYNRDFTGITCSGDGTVWFGTRKGAIRFDGKDWAYRQGRAWLPHDEVRRIAVDKQGNAWFATPGGVGCIERRMMTLAEKAAFYEEEIEKYIKRTPFGYTSEVGLVRPGDKSEVIYSDSDNDGLWTSMYGVGECFAYGATKSPEAKRRAKEAFEALRFLQKVTQGCEHSPPKGYVARTIRSTDDPDPNIGRIEQDRQARAEGDKLWKVYEPRWPKSADGKWYWKSDTSSDELDGHYFFYPAYYDLVADTEAEKERVREVVRDLTDHLMDHGYYLIDHDGTPTRWGVYGPESLNNDPNWWEERGLKSLSMLSYLAVAGHMTGDPKYEAAIEELVEKHGYRANAMIYKTHFGIGSGNQSDDEMAFMSYYNLVKYAKNEALRNQILYSFYSAWTVEQPEMNPFFNFAYAAFGLGASYASPWGSFPIRPWRGWLDDALATLKGFPLDRVQWARQNSHRLDIIRLPRQQATEPYAPMRPGRGYRVNGKVLPVEERFFDHWNTDPWALDYGGNGHGLASGAVFLLPYYMGLYHGFIQETE